MKVENNSAPQATTDHDQTNTVAAPEQVPGDFFFDLISRLFMQATPQPVTDGADIETEVTSDDILHTESEAETTSLNPFDAALLANLSLPVDASQQSLPQQSQQPQQPVQENDVGQDLAANNQAINTINQTPVIKEALKPAISVDSFEVNQILKENIAKIKELKKEDISMSSMNVVENSSDVEQFLQTKETIKQKINEPNLSLQNLNQPIDLLANQFVQPVAASLNAQNQDQGHAEANQYQNALVQLGEMINSHTKSLANPESTNLTLSHPSADYASLLNNQAKVQHPHLEIKLESLPASARDAVIKETYNANIKIYPPELGTVLAKLRIGQNIAELVILTENDKVKEIVQANLNQLREQFQQSNIQLTSIDVQTSPQETKDQNENQQHLQQSFAAREKTNESNQSTTVSKETKHNIDALVDTYA